MKQSSKPVSGAAPAAAMLVLLAYGGGAGAEDIGQISVIEDTDGRMLPALGFCSMLLYPNAFCIPFAGQAFYASHLDSYDILIFITNKNIRALEKAGYPVQADVRGIGQDTVPWSYTHFGSGGRLLQALDLGSVQSMPDDPEGIFSEVPISGLEVIGHEIGHHWMAYASIDLGDGRGVLDIIRGHQESGTITHWSCRLNSDSVMYGGMLTDNGDGTFTDVNGIRKYSLFDQYLMGLRGADEVGPMWYVADGASPYGCAELPQARGVAHDISGERVDFSMDDVIRALGERDPPISPCHYKVAFIFVHSPGQPPSAADLDKVERYRTALETWYAGATDGRGSLDTRLDGCGTGTPQCPGAPSVQCENPPDEIGYEEGEDAVIDGEDAVVDDTDAGIEIDEPDAAVDVPDTAGDPDAAGEDAGTDDGGEGGEGGCGCRLAS